jgi:hypothetical protein
MMFDVWCLIFRVLFLSIKLMLESNVKIKINNIENERWMIIDEWWKISSEW